MKTGPTKIPTVIWQANIRKSHRFFKHIATSIAAFVALGVLALAGSAQVFNVGGWDLLPDNIFPPGPVYNLGPSVGNGKDVYFIGSSDSSYQASNLEIYKWSADGGWQLLGYTGVGVPLASYRGWFGAIAVYGKFLYVGGSFGGSRGGIPTSTLCYPNGQSITATNIARYNLDTEEWEEIGFADNSPNGTGWIQAITTDARGNVYIGTHAQSQNDSLYTDVLQQWNGRAWIPIGGTNWGLVAAGGGGGIKALASDGLNIYIGGDFGGVGTIDPTWGILGINVWSRGVIKYKPFAVPCPPYGACPDYRPFPPGPLMFEPVGGYVKFSFPMTTVPAGVFNNTSEYENGSYYFNDPIGVNSIALVGSNVFAAGSFLLPAVGIARFPTVEPRFGIKLPINDLLYGNYPGTGLSLAVQKVGGVPVLYVSGNFNVIAGTASPSIEAASVASWVNLLAPNGRWQSLASGLTYGGEPAPCYLAATTDALYADNVFDTAGGKTVQQADPAAARWTNILLIALNSNQTNYTFSNAATYSISGNLHFNGTTTIQPGAIINPSGGFGSVEIDGDLVCPSNSDASAIFTCSVFMSNNVSALQNLDFMGGQLTFELNTNASPITIKDCRFVGSGITWQYTPRTDGDPSYSLTLNNCLAINAGTFISDRTGRGSFQLVNCTLDNWVYPIANNNYPQDTNGDSFSAINCIFSDIADGHSDNPGETAYSGSNNGFYNYDFDAANPTTFGSAPIPLTDWPFYQSPPVDDTSYRLATNSPCLNTGTANIDPSLLKELAGLSTYAPGDGGFPDNDGMVDLGYHYPTATPATPCQPAPYGMVDLWSAESKTDDSIGFNNGTLEGTASFAPGEVGEAFSFDGSSGYVSIPDSPSLDSFSAMTIECWIKSGKTGANSGWEGLVCKGNSSWRLMGTSRANTVYVAFDGASPSDLYSTRNVNDEQWHHIAATYDGSTMCLYVDGVLDVSQSATGAIVQTSDGLTIGNNAGQPGLLWNGLIDEVSLYNRALSANEIAAIYLAGSSGKCFTLPLCVPPPSGIVDWWSAESNTLDSIGVNNGTLEGTASYAPGEVGQAFSFDGLNGYVSVPDSPSLDSFVNSITIECWVKPTSLAPNADWEGLVCKGNTSWRLQATSGTNTATFSATGLSTQDLYGTRNINDGQWHHLAGVYDGSTMYLYVDGTLDVSQPSTGSIAQNDVPLAIGNNDQAYPGHSYMFNGLIDEVSLYNRALSSKEIAAIYAAGPSGMCFTPPLLPPCEPVPSGIVDWWSAENNTFDSIGANDGTLEGTASFAPGEVGEAFSFDGSSGYVSIPDSPSLDSFTSAMTIECWIKSGKTGANSGWEGLVCKGNSSWRIMGTSEDNTVYVAFDGASTDLYGTRNVNDEQWHHIAATYDGNTIRLYVDGTLDASEAATGSIIQTSDDLTIGNNEGQPGMLWNGLIDEVSLYNRALSSNEIAAIYAAGFSGKCPP